MRKVLNLSVGSQMKIDGYFKNFEKRKRRGHKAVGDVKLDITAFHNTAFIRECEGEYDTYNNFCRNTCCKRNRCRSLTPGVDRE